MSADDVAAGMGHGIFYLGGVLAGVVEPFEQDDCVLSRALGSPGPSSYVRAASPHFGRWLDNPVTLEL